jgi:hypothetical protein
MTSILTDELFEQGPEPILLVDKASPAVPAPRENLSFDQAVENTQTLNIRYVGAAGQW